MGRSTRSGRPGVPTLIYDDDCGFCTWCADFVARHGEFDLVGFGELTPAQRERLPEGWEECAHLLVDGEVHSCGKAAELSLAWAFPATRPAFGVARKVPGYERALEGLYRWAADRRALWGRLVRREDVRRD